jgi:hypothetical protein
LPARYRAASKSRAGPRRPASLTRAGDLTEQQPQGPAAPKPAKRCQSGLPDGRAALSACRGRRFRNSRRLRKEAHENHIASRQVPSAALAPG